MVKLYKIQSYRFCLGCVWYREWICREMIPENGIEEKENWSGEWDLTLLFGSTEISAENCNRESFLLFG